MPEILTLDKWNIDILIVFHKKLWQWRDNNMMMLEAWPSEGGGGGGGEKWKIYETFFYVEKTPGLETLCNKTKKANQKTSVGWQHKRVENNKTNKAPASCFCSTASHHCKNWRGGGVPESNSIG